MKSLPIDRGQKRTPILVLVICPTREITCQAAAEATHHSHTIKYYAYIDQMDKRMHLDLVLNLP